MPIYELDWVAWVTLVSSIQDQLWTSPCVAIHWLVATDDWCTPGTQHTMPPGYHQPRYHWYDHEIMNWFLRRHRCRHNPGVGNKSTILPLEDDRGNIIGERMTKEERIAFERRHSQVWGYHHMHMFILKSESFRQHWWSKVNWHPSNNHLQQWQQSHPHLLPWLQHHQALCKQHLQALSKQHLAQFRKLQAPIKLLLVQLSKHQVPSRLPQVLAKKLLVLSKPPVLWRLFPLQLWEDLPLHQDHLRLLRQSHWVPTCLASLKVTI